jgi:hypothetical protein
MKSFTIAPVVRLVTVENSSATVAPVYATKNLILLKNIWETPKEHYAKYNDIL